MHAGTTASRVSRGAAVASWYYAGLTTATLQLAPEEVVAVPLPPVGNEKTDATAFAARALSFRMRVRPIR